MTDSSTVDNEYRLKTSTLRWRQPGLETSAASNDDYSMMTRSTTDERPEMKGGRAKGSTRAKQQQQQRHLTFVPMAGAVSVPDLSPSYTADDSRHQTMLLDGATMLTDSPLLFPAHSTSAINNYGGLVTTLDSGGADFSGRLLPSDRFLGVDRRGGVVGESMITAVEIDFTKPDAQRQRPLVVEGKRLYVCDQYMSVWSPVLRASMIECPSRELILPTVKYSCLLEVLQCISPMHKRVTEANLNEVLPVAFEYQMGGLLHRCECLLMETRLPIMERLWLADRYKLHRLLVQCLRDCRPQAKLDLAGPKYYTLSDRVKVQLLERLQGAQAPEEPPEPPLDADEFSRPSELHFACIRSKTGKAFYVNPFYMATWSNSIAERLSSAHAMDFTCSATTDELSTFLIAIFPPQLRITEHNIGPILMAGCKLESPGVIRRCADFILNPQTHLTTFAKLSLLDRCFIHELLDVCLKMGVSKPEQALDMATQQTYDCLSTKARAAILDRLAQLLKKPGLMPHYCIRCKHRASCHLVNWVCPQCGGYNSNEKQ